MPNETEPKQEALTIATSEDLDNLLTALASSPQTYPITVYGLTFTAKRLPDMQAHIDIRAEAAKKLKAITAGTYPAPWKESVKSGPPLGFETVLSCVYVSKCIEAPTISFMKALQMARQAAPLLGALAAHVMEQTVSQIEAEEEAIDVEGEA